MNVVLSDAETARFARQLALPGFHGQTQEFLRAARVHVVGAGEVGGPALLYLAGAGVGSVLVDDPLDVTPEDAAAWLYRPDQVGQPRFMAAMEALRAATSFSRPRAYATGAEPTAILVAGESSSVTREAAERARLSGLPHVVAVADGEGGEVVSVPPGAPCYACGSRPGSGGPTRPGVAAAIAALAVTELLLILSGNVLGSRGRRIDLLLGRPESRPTARVPGCACGP